MRRMLLTSAFLALAAASSCLFSTTPPRPESPPGENTNPNLTVITGLVRHRDRDGRYVSMPGRMVHAQWLGPDPASPGHFLPLTTSIVRSGNGGSYRVQVTDSRLVAVELKALRCEYDPDNPDPNTDCCLETPPCPEGCLAIWRVPKRVTAHPGDRLQQDMIVPCDYLP